MIEVNYPGVLFFIGYLIMTYFIIYQIRKLWRRIDDNESYDPPLGVPTLIGSLIGIIIAAIVYHLIK